MLPLVVFHLPRLVKRSRDERRDERRARLLLHEGRRLEVASARWATARWATARWAKPQENKHRHDRQSIAAHPQV